MDEQASDQVRGQDEEVCDRGPRGPPASHEAIQGRVKAVLPRTTWAAQLPLGVDRVHDQHPRYLGGGIDIVPVYSPAGRTRSLERLFHLLVNILGRNQVVDERTQKRRPTSRATESPVVKRQGTGNNPQVAVRAFFKHVCLPGSVLASVAWELSLQGERETVRGQHARDPQAPTTSDAGPLTSIVRKGTECGPVMSKPQDSYHRGPRCKRDNPRHEPGGTTDPAAKPAASSP